MRPTRYKACNSCVGSAVGPIEQDLVDREGVGLLGLERSDRGFAARVGDDLRVDEPALERDGRRAAFHVRRALLDELEAVLARRLDPVNLRPRTVQLRLHARDNASPRKAMFTTFVVRIRSTVEDCALATAGDSSARRAINFERIRHSTEGTATLASA